jgi:ubiquinone biosynthesis protein
MPGPCVAGPLAAVLASAIVFKAAFQDLNRLRQIAAVVAKHGFGAYLERTRLADLLGKREAAAPEAPGEEAGPGPDRKTAVRFRQLLLDLGPTYIKLGQLLSCRPDILPMHWIEELSELQDACPPLPLSDVRRGIEQGLGRPVAELFADLDPEPLASASIAQVHRARTHSGEEVVVKVQRPRVREQVESDLGLLYYLARLLEAVVEETGIYTPTGIIEEFDRSVHEELDFENEARNARDMAAALRGLDFLVIPKVHGLLSSSTVLTLDYVAGVKASDVTAAGGYDLEQVARNIIAAAFRQLFDSGIFHGDPHPGNVLVLSGNRIALLDFGLVGRLTRPMQEALVTLIMAVSLRDPDTVARILNRIGVPEAHTPIAAFRADISQMLEHYLGLKLDEIPTSTLLQDLLDLAIRHKIKVPKEYALLSKAAVSVEGLIRRLYPKLDMLEIGLPYAKDLLLSRLSPTDASGTLMKSLLKLQSLAEDVPAQLTQILSDLEGGKFRVRVHSEDLARIAFNIRSLSLTLFLGLLASALTVGGLFMVSRDLAGWGSLGFAVLILAGGLFGAALAVYVLGGRLPKISLRRFLSK